MHEARHRPFRRNPRKPAYCETGRPYLRRTSGLVLCGGGGAESQAVAICSHLYRLEQPCSNARLVWHDWMSPQDWEDAVLVWHWDSRPDARLIQRALGLGLPIVAP